MTTISIDDLLASRDRLDAERKAKGTPAGRGPAAAPEVSAENLTLIAMIGLWLLLTGLIVLSIIASLLRALAEVVEWISRENAKRRTTRRRR